MTIAFTTEQNLMRDSVRKMTQAIATRDYLAAMDREGRYPHEVYDAWVEAGMFAMPFPEAYGGLGGGIVEMALIVDELAYVNYDIAAAYAVVLYTSTTLLKCGSEEQKRHYLPRIFDGSVRMSVSISEPQAGSDVGAIRTSARRDGDGWVLNGRKVWATAAGARDNIIQVYARTSSDRGPHGGLTVFLVPNDTPGVECRKLDMLGRRGTGTYEIFLDDVRVPADAVLGQVDHGWDILMACLQTERLSTAAGYVGSGRKVFDLALSYARERTQFGKPIGAFQAIGHMLADMQTEQEAGSLLMWNAVEKMARGENALREVTMAKLFCSEAYVRAANAGIQVMGAAGYSMEYEMQQHYRDARSTTIGAGSSQMQRNLLANLMGLKAR
ncbi:acyl-CoA dehydrogenase [Pigmentiphaga soli]|uniref:Acyl-CoA dehydrogenase n=1 Tax=Pigmentiphaga soli TaxID=1007095 RepID=A0ABP8GT36_9BURK